MILVISSVKELANKVCSSIQEAAEYVQPRICEHCRQCALDGQEVVLDHETGEQKLVKFDSVFDTKCGKLFRIEGMK